MKEKEENHEQGRRAASSRLSVERTGDGGDVAQTAGELQPVAASHPSTGVG
jgi:hypothetical protein